jgi:hypothetical protein
VTSDRLWKIAIELALLRDSRPVKRIPFNRGTRKGTRILRSNPAYADHMAKEYPLSEEIYGRIGTEKGDELIAKAQDVIKMFT